jgi:anti-sigma-K factor RskA
MNIRAHDIDGEPPNADLRAGEYALGVLDRDERLQAQARIESEPAFARLVADWERRFTPLLADIEPVPPSPQVWPQLRRRLGWAPVEGARGAGLWNDAGFWRVAAGLAAAAALAVVVIGRPPAPVEPGPGPQIVQPAAGEVARPVTPLARDDGSPGWLATVDRDQGKVLMVPVPSPADAQGRVAELWLIAQGEAPRSLGLVSNDKAHSLKIPPDLLAKFAIGATLAITLEPPLGIPHAAPTGPIVAKGSITAI